MDKTILITGGSGLIGSHLTPLLKESGYNVRILTTRRSKEINGTKAFRWNPDDLWMEKEAIEGVTDVIHLAGANISKRWSAKYKQRIVDSRVNGIQTLKKYLERSDHKLDSFISSSGISYYVPNTNRIAKEEDEGGISFLADVCKIWELNADFMKPFAKRVIKIRTGIVLDKKDGALVPLMKLTNYGIISPLASGKQIMSWIHIQDVVDIFRFGIENKIEGVYNAVAPNVVSNKEFIDTLSKTMNRPSFLPNVPKIALKLVMGEMSELVIDSINASSEKIRNEGYQFKYSNLKSALDNIINESEAKNGK